MASLTCLMVFGACTSGSSSRYVLSASLMATFSASVIGVLGVSDMILDIRPCDLVDVVRANTAENT